MAQERRRRARARRAHPSVVRRVLALARRVPRPDRAGAAAARRAGARVRHRHRHRRDRGAARQARRAAASSPPTSTRARSPAPPRTSRGWASAKQVRVVAADMFPEGRAALVVCNPPWVPTPANAAIERAVYDPDSAMLRAFLAGLAAHLAPGGEGWLVMSDLAEHLGLRTRDEMLAWIADAGLRVVARHDTRPDASEGRRPGRSAVRGAQPGSDVAVAAGGGMTTEGALPVAVDAAPATARDRRQRRARAARDPRRPRGDEVVRHRPAGRPRGRREA